LDQLLHLTFLVATLLANTSFCSYGVNLLNASNSIIFFFFSSVNSTFSSFSYCSSFVLSLVSLVSSAVGVSFSLLATTGFFDGNFFLNL
jgi:hypothetical protein